MTRHRKILFHSPTHPWPSFSPVNDTIRGGSSSSHWTIDQDVAIFSGHLDTQTLGGAGFASRATSFPPAAPLSLPANKYSGLSLLIQLAQKHVLSTDSEKIPLPTSYVLTLKPSFPDHRPDGRREAVLSYEFAFDTQHLVGENDQEKVVELRANWDEFKATYRGRQDPNAPSLDPSKIYELSFMCRSNFGQQEGDFELRIVELAAIENKGSEIQAMWDWISGWLAGSWEMLLRWFGKDEKGLRLP